MQSGGASQQDEGQLEARVTRAAEAALAQSGYVSLIDVLTGMQLLYSGHVEDWRKGRIPVLETWIQGSPRKISRSIAIFREWARKRGLKPAEISYVRQTRTGPTDLQFTAGGDPEIEQVFRTHYLSPALSERKKESLQERLERPPERVVFWNLRDSRCSECGAEIESGSFLFMEAGEPLCLPCAGLGELEFLPRGDAALTRRAGKYSELSAVVVKFSRSRGRYERQGILVEEAALRRAEEECTSDAAERAQRRVRDAALRAGQDKQFAEDMAASIQELFPGCPPGEARAIAAHAAVRGSGRVGRTAAGRALKEKALTLAVVAAIRHRHTNYDELLLKGMERGQARETVAERVDEILEGWKTKPTR